MKTLCLIVGLFAMGCQSIPESEKVTYRGVSKEENAAAVVAILKCLPQNDCNLLGEQLECGPFLWRELNAPSLTTVTTYTLPVNLADGSQDVKWEGRRCATHAEVLDLWHAFQNAIPQKSLQTVRSLKKEECRIYNTLVPGEIREPVFIVEGRGHKILFQIANGQLSYIDDFRNVVVRD